MRRPQACAAIVSLLVAGAAAAETGTDTATLALTRDIVVKVSADQGEADGRIEAQVDIVATPAKVWSIMLDCARAQKFLTALKSCKVLESAPDGSTDIREHRSRWLALLPETVSVFRSVYIKEREIDFERVSGDFRFLKGSWRLQPLDGGRATRVSYDARIGAGVPLPGFMIRAALEEDVPRFLSAFRDEAEHGP